MRMRLVFKMYASVVFFGLLASAWGLYPQLLQTQTDGRIVGGRPIDIKEAPHQISLQEGLYHICGGSIISKRYVVTAAHCIEFREKYSIRAGSSYKGDGGVVVKVAKMRLHPNYMDPTCLNPDNDVAVLQLEEDLEFNENIQPIPLAEENEDFPAGTNCVTSGWGDVVENVTQTYQLQAVEVPIVDRDRCQKLYSGKGTVTENMICAGFVEGGKDSCHGDSGGPLVSNGKLIGIVSWGEGCARPGYPGVYASVPAVRKFIKEISGV